MKLLNNLKIIKKAQETLSLYKNTLKILKLLIKNYLIHLKYPKYLKKKMNIQ